MLYCFHMQPRFTYLLGSLIMLLGGAPFIPAQAAPQLHSEVFQAFTSHIQRQVEVDKRSFAQASECTQWFYKQERREKPAPPDVEGVRWDPGAARAAGRPQRVALDCDSRYPGGLVAAREDFGRAQSTLSLSLTFYEFALVGDRDDDQQYSDLELRHIIESFGLTYNPGLPSALQASTLNAQFDSVHQEREFEVLMDGMGKLFDQGYRFTFRDKEALNRIMG